MYIIVVCLFYWFKINVKYQLEETVQKSKSELTKQQSTMKFKISRRSDSMYSQKITEVKPGDLKGAVCSSFNYYFHPYRTQY